MVGYREIAERQHGFILPCQLTDEEFVEAAKNGFICIPSEYRELMGYVYFTELVEGGRDRTQYLDWLIAFLIPPEERHPTPYIAGRKALEIHGFWTSGSFAPSAIVTPPELMPHINEKYGYTYLVDENITPDHWVFVGDTPVEKIIPAMRKYCEYAVPDDFENAMDIAYGAYYRGYSWEEIAWALEPAVGIWSRHATNGKEILELFFEEYPPRSRDTDEP